MMMSRSCPAAHSGRASNPAQCHPRLKAGGQLVCRKVLMRSGSSNEQQTQVEPIKQQEPSPVTSAKQAEAPAQSITDMISSNKAYAVAAAAVIGMTALFAGSQPTLASSTKVAEFQASGFLFKDSVEVTALEDPEIPGVTLFISDFKRSLVDKLAKDFFSEPSQASLTCAVTGPVSFKSGDPSKLGGSEGSEVFSEAKGINLFRNKTLRIRRVYDAKHNSAIYIAYSTRLSSAADDGNISSGRYRTSICAVKLPDSLVAPPAAAAAANN